MTGGRRSRPIMRLLAAALLITPAIAMMAPADAQTATASTEGWDENPAGGDGRHFRIALDVDVGSLAGVRNLPVQTIVNVAELLAQHSGYPHAVSPGSGRTLLRGFDLDPDSFTLWEHRGDGSSVEIPLLVTPGSLEDDEPFHPSTNPVVTVRWVMPGESSGVRHFYLYFDSVQNSGAEIDARPYDPRDLAALASSIGPGRGTRLYVPLYPLPGIQDVGEARHVRITNLFDGTNTVRVYEYRSNGMPRAEPAAQYDLPVAGHTATYFFGNNGKESSRGSLLVVADRPVVAEAVSTPSGSSFVPNAFIPSADGGYVGRDFRFLAAASEQWQVHCHPVMAGELSTGNQGCRVTLDGGASRAVASGSTTTYSVAPGSSHRVTATIGSVLVQRLGEGMVAWPPIDGPTVAATFTGNAGATDALVITSGQDDACLNVQSLGPGNPVLAARVGSGRMCIQKGLFAENIYPWASQWDRVWETGNSHAGGAARISEFTGKGGITITSGSIPDRRQFSTLVAPQSTDGGFHYDLYIPAPKDDPGLVLGSIVVFAMYNGTTVTLTERTTGEQLRYGPLPAHQRLDVSGQDLQRGGLWSVDADRPITAFWLKRGASNFGGPAAGLTSAGTVTVAGASYIGAAIDLSPLTSTAVQKQGGDTARFKLEVRNMGRDISGQSVPDDGISADVVPGRWNARAILSSMNLPADGSATVDVTMTVPPDVDVTQGGMTFTLRIRSGSNPDLVVEQPLRINFVVTRCVDVRANGEGTEETNNILPDETATYEVTVTNCGSVADQYTVAHSQPGSAWTQAFDPVSYNGSVDKTPLLAPDESAVYALVLQPSEGANAAARQVTNILATSTSDRSISDPVRVVTAIGANRSFSIAVDDALRTLAPGEVTTFTVRIHNQADVNEALEVDVLPSLPDASWEAPAVRWVEKSTSLENVNHTITVAAQEIATLEVTQQVPEGADALALATSTLRFRSLFTPESPGTDVDLRILVARFAGVQASLSQEGSQARPGSTLNLNLTLTSTGNTDQEIRVTPNLSGGAAGWILRSAEGAEAPWNLTLPEGKTTSLEMHLDVPADAPPSGQRPSELTFTLSTPGTRAVVTALSLDIPEHRALRLEETTRTLPAGMQTVVRAQVHNLGNVPLQITGRVEGLVDGWSARVAATTVPAGSAATIPVTIDLPADATNDGGVAAVLYLRDVETGQLLDAAALRITPGGPRLAIALADEVAVGDGQVSYLVTLNNTGTDVASNITVRLMQAGHAVDTFLITQILPGRQHVAALVGPADTRTLQVHVQAAHDPLGVAKPLAELGAVSSDARTIPGIAPPLLAVLLLVARRKEVSP